MDWKTIKASADLKLCGIDIQVDREDRLIKMVTFTDECGNQVRINGTYGISVQVPQEPETRKVTHITGTIAGVQIDEIVDGENTSYSEARNRVDELKRAGAEVEAHDAEAAVEF